MAYDTPENIETILKNLPFKPGVYVMKDENDKKEYPASDFKYILIHSRKVGRRV